MKKTSFIINVFIMTGSMIVIRLAGIFSGIYISAKAGAEAMGLYHVIFSVYSFAATISVSGTGLAATRLVSESFGRKSCSKVQIIKKCLTVAICASLFAAAALYAASGYISGYLSDSIDCEPALKLLAVSLPFMGMSAVFRGGFIAVRKAAVITGSQILEEFSSIFITVYTLKNYSGTPYAYMSIIMGNCFSEITAFIYDFIMYKITFKKSISSEAVTTKSVLNICAPVALGSYLRTGLVTVENILIPKQLGRYGISNPLSEYGIIKAMAMQIILFPTVFIQSFASLLVPEMSEMNASLRKNGIKHVAVLAIKFTLIFAFAAAYIFYKYHDEIAQLLYKNSKVSYYLGMLSLLVILMYLDSVVDSMLKGLNQQMSNLHYNIADSCLRIAAIWIFLPKYGINAYIAMLYVSELFNLSLSMGRLIYVTGLRINITDCVIYPLLCIGISGMLTELFKLNGFVTEIIVFIAFYLLFVFEKTLLKKIFSA